MRILVTGATGFIGSHLVDYLLSRSHEVIATSDNTIYRKEHENLIYISHDLNQPCENYFELFQKPDIAIHLAWENLPNYKELFHIEKNLWTNYFFLKNLIENGLKDFTVMGTCMEYGKTEGCLSEYMPAVPVTSYGLAKDCLRKFIGELSKHYSFNYKWIRLFYLYGAGQSKKSILSQLEMAIKNGERTFKMSGGKQLRDYLPVEKVAEYTAHIALQQEFTGVVNCCRGKPISIFDLVKNRLAEIKQDIKLELGYYPYTDYEPMECWGDNTKLKKILKGKI